jgi:rare lipoprotein A
MKPCHTTRLTRTIVFAATLTAAGCVSSAGTGTRGPSAELQPAIATTTQSDVLAAAQRLAQQPARAVTAADSADPAGLSGARDAAVLEVQTGVASYYANSLAGRRTASGERYDPQDLVAAHRDLPFGTILRVTNLTNDRAVEVRVIDRGPFTSGRVLDLSRRAAEELDMISAGHVQVRIEVLAYGATQDRQ